MVILSINEIIRRGGRGIQKKAWWQGLSKMAQKRLRSFMYIPLSKLVLYNYFLLIIYLFFTYSVSSGDRHIRNNIFILSKYFKMSEQMILSRKLRDILLLNVNLSISIRYRINLDFSWYCTFSNLLSCNLWSERFMQLMTKQPIIPGKQLLLCLEGK